MAAIAVAPAAVVVSETAAYTVVAVGGCATLIAMKGKALWGTITGAIGTWTAAGTSGAGVASTAGTAGAVVEGAVAAEAVVVAEVVVAAEVAAETVVLGTMSAAGTVATSATPGLIASLVASPVGLVVAGAVVAVASYHAYQYWKSPNVFDGTDRDEQANPSPNEPDPEDRDPLKLLEWLRKTCLGRKKLDVHIQKNHSRKIFETHGRRIYQNLKQRTNSGKSSGIWKNKDFRIDPGQTVKGRPHVKTWNLQMNHGASRGIRKTYKRFSTHQKLLWDCFDLHDPPDYETWLRHIIDLLS